MSDEAPPVVWLSLDAGEARADAVRALDEWARARGVRIAALEEQATTLTVDPSLGERVEKELERAHLAVGAADVDATERALARAETVLREHPELPQAAWLRAEVERAWSARWLRLEPRDEARARVAWENAHALDGGRVAGVGETAFQPRAKVPTAFIITNGKSPRITLRLDGIAREKSASSGSDAEYRVELAPGEHHVLATSDGRIAFASWVAINATTAAPPTRISLYGGGACSRDRFEDVRLDNGQQVRATGVTCPRWIAAIPGERRGSVRVARCENDTCGQLLEWRLEQLPSQTAPEAHARASRWPTWATWTIVGIGAATAASIALIATGVFESRPVEQRFVVGGARQE